ncbi:MAG: RNA polymerase sigma factor [Faecousia sp.]
MDDKAIIDLYWKRSEAAITETDAKYGGYCYSIAYNVLANREDAEESVSDTYLAAWNRLPPQRPAILSAFLGRITRYLSISRWRSQKAEKRGGGEIVLALEELGDCVSGGQCLEEACTRKEATQALNRFLGTLPQTERDVFLRRYWCLDPVADIAESFHFSESKVTSMLHRTRMKLRRQMEKEGYL